MTRSSETFALFNPALTAAVLASAAMDHRTTTGEGMPVELGFLVVPLTLHEPFRQALPSRASARLAAWLLSHAALRGDFPRIAAAYVPITREGLRAGLRSGALARQADRLDGALRPRQDDLSEETLAALNKARLLGRWLGQSAAPAITYRLFGVRP